MHLGSYQISVTAAGARLYCMIEKIVRGQNQWRHNTIYARKEDHSRRAPPFRNFHPEDTHIRMGGASAIWGHYLEQAWAVERMQASWNVNSRVI